MKTRQCADCPAYIPIMGNKKRCAECDDKMRTERLRLKSLRQQQERRQRDKAEREQAPARTTGQ